MTVKIEGAVWTRVSIIEGDDAKRFGYRDDAMTEITLHVPTEVARALLNDNEPARRAEKSDT